MYDQNINDIRALWKLQGLLVHCKHIIAYIGSIAHQHLKSSEYTVSLKMNLRIK